VALLLIAKFKRFKGFGFEAEMWEQKQIEAAALIDQLRSLSKVISRQMASIAARVGLWDSALSLAELAKFLEDLQQQLSAMDIPPHETDEILDRLYQRVIAAYYAEARHELGVAFTCASDAVKSALGASDAETHLRALNMVPDMNSEADAMSTLPLRSIDALVEFVSKSKIVERKAETTENLREIDRDLQHFQIHHSFRRKEWLPQVAH
jgi:hypothetical protein